MNQMQSDNTTDFVTRYVKLLAQITDAPAEFQEAAALVLISTAVGRRWLFRSLPDTAIFSEKTAPSGKLLNLWFAILGKSRITRKTSGVLSHVEEAVKETIGEQQLISAAFTPEALIKEMAEKAVPSTILGHETPCFWICDEISWFFHQLKRKDSYMASVDAFLSKIYDGNTYSRSTIGRGKETISNPYLTCLVASTDFLPTLFDELQIRRGFMNRFVFVIVDRTERKSLPSRRLTDEEKKEAKELKVFLKSLAEKTTVTVLEMTSEAKQAYDSYEEQIERQIAEKNLGIKESYCGQLPNLVVRLSCLYRISRMTTEEIRNYNNPVLIVEKQDVERAIGYAMKAWSWFGKVIEIMQSSQKARLLLPIENAETAILRFLSDGLERHVNEMREYVIHRAEVSPATFYSALKNLKNNGRVVRPRPDYYKIVKKANEPIEGEKK